MEGFVARLLFDLFFLFISSLDMVWVAPKFSTDLCVKIIGLGKWTPKLFGTGHLFSAHLLDSATQRGTNLNSFLFLSCFCDISSHFAHAFFPLEGKVTSFFTGNKRKDKESQWMKKDKLGQNFFHIKKDHSEEKHEFLEINGITSWPLVACLLAHGFTNIYLVLYAHCFVQHTYSSMVQYIRYVHKWKKVSLCFFSNLIPDETTVHLIFLMSKYE